MNSSINLMFKNKKEMSLEVCINKTCKAPTDDINKALEYLNSKP